MTLGPVIQGHSLNTFMINKKLFFGSIKGQVILETAFVFIISMVLVFGIIDLARLGYVLMHLHGSAGAAGRAVSVNKSPRPAAYYIMYRTEPVYSGLLWPSVGNSETSITGTDSPYLGGDFGDSALKVLGWKPLSDDESKNVKVANGALTFSFKPLWISSAWTVSALIYGRIKVPYRTVVEKPQSLPPY